MRNRLILIAAAAGLAAPAIAQQPAPNAARTNSAQAPAAQSAPRPADDIRAQLPAKEELERVGEVAARAADAILEVPIGPLREAVEGRKLSKKEREETLGDHAAKDDPYFRERMRDQMAVATVALGALAEQMAVMTPILRQTLEDAQRRVEEAARGLPERREEPAKHR
ncbi:MAG TPA: hypothetical protein VNT25_07660 [Allosphingosinicella sp.]|nr:hypothetical protein [Allosphingosinicella sp.]